MGAPLLLADNLFSVPQYPKHVITDQSGAIGPVGFETWRVADGRRSAFDFWAPGTNNAEAYVRVQCDRLRAANCLVIDRGHNLGGVAGVTLQGSLDGTTWLTVANPTIPPGGGVITDANGVTTEEGAFLLAFGTQAYIYWRLDVLAMGVGLQPNIVGLWLGMAYRPVAAYRPYPEHPTVLSAQEVVTPWGWRGRGARGFNRAGTLAIRCDTFAEYELARFTLEELYGAGRPMWIAQDADLASQAFLAIRPTGQGGFERPGNWTFPTYAVPFVEHEPLPVS